MQLAVCPSHPLAARAEVHPVDLDGIAFIAFDEDLSIRRELDRFLRASGVTVDVVMHFDNIQTIKEAVALGSGVSILPARTMQTEIDQGHLVAIPLHAPDPGPASGHPAPAEEETSPRRASVSGTGRRGGLPIRRDIIALMSTLPALVSVDEYLHTAYRPDCDYVDGVVVERNVGEKSHAKLQREILLYLHARRKQWGTFVIQECPTSG